MGDNPGAWTAVPSTTTPSPTITETDIHRLTTAIRLARSRAPQGKGTEVATILSLGPLVFPQMNATQCQQLFEAFVKKPKSDIARTLLRLHPTAQARAVLCPWL